MEKNRNEYMREYYRKNKERVREYRRQYSKDVVYKKFKKVCALVDRDLAEKFENKLLEDKSNMTDFIIKAIKEYIKE